MSEQLDRHEDPIAEYYGSAALSAVELVQRRRKRRKIVLTATGVLLLILLGAGILWLAAGPALSVPNA